MGDRSNDAWTARVQFKHVRPGFQGQREVNVHTKPPNQADFNELNLIYYGVHHWVQNQTFLHDFSDKRRMCSLQFSSKLTTINMSGGALTVYMKDDRQEQLKTASEDSVISYDRTANRAALRMNRDSLTIPRNTSAKSDTFDAFYFVEYVFPNNNPARFISTIAQLIVLEHSGIIKEHSHFLGAVGNTLTAPLDPLLRKRKSDSALVAPNAHLAPPTKSARTSLSSSRAGSEEPLPESANQSAPGIPQVTVTPSAPTGASTATETQQPRRYRLFGFGNPNGPSIEWS